jgi:diphthamide synthase (EF-2-diphthine--ammonia ligase)
MVTNWSPWRISIPNRISVGRSYNPSRTRLDRLLDELDSYMYQSVGHEIIDLFAQAMELPLYRAEIKGDAQTTEKEYPQPIDGDEVEDLYHLLREVKVNEG